MLCLLLHRQSRLHDKNHIARKTTDTWKDRQANLRHTDRQTDRKTDRQTQTDRQAGRQTDSQTGQDRQNKRSDSTDGRTHRHANISDHKQQAEDSVAHLFNDGRSMQG